MLIKMYFLYLRMSEHAIDLGNFLIAISGLVISVILAYRDYKRSKTKIEAELYYSMGEVNSVTITNLSNRTITITYLGFYWDNKWNPEIDIGMFEGCRISVGKDRLFSFPIKGEMYESDFCKEGKLYVRLKITGDKKYKRILVTQ